MPTLFKRMTQPSLTLQFLVKNFEGFQIPGFWLAWLGIDGTTDISILGHEVFTVAGQAGVFHDWQEPENAQHPR